MAFITLTPGQYAAITGAGRVLPGAEEAGDESRNLPAGVTGPMINDEFADVTFALFALKAKREPQRLLVRDAETLRQQLLHVRGQESQYYRRTGRTVYISFSHERLATMGLSPQDIFNALNNQNALTAAGSIETRGAQIFIRLDGAFDELQKIRDTPFIAQGKTLKLSDVATVERGLKTRPLCRFVTNMNRRCCWGS